MPDGGISIVAQARAVAFSVAMPPDRASPRLFGDHGSDPLKQPRHPWLAAFATSPADEFNNLITGHADLGTLSRLDPPDAADMLFGQLHDDDPARLALDWAVLGWLEARRRQPPPEEQADRQCWIREVQDAFDIVALVRARSAANALRRGFASWNAWASELVMAPARDARAAYWSMLAQTQPLLREAQPDLNPFSLASHWLRICGDAGGNLPSHYLAIGLLGLRRLPDTADGSEIPWLTGLADWALTQRPSREAFLTQWKALKSLYPRTPMHWRRRIDQVLSQDRFRCQGLLSPAWWGEDPDLA